MSSSRALPFTLHVHFRELQNEFANVLEDAGKKRADNDELAIFIDGMDLLETAGKMSLLGWLPDPVPKVKDSGII